MKRMKMNLPASFRRTLFMLLAGMVVALMFLYWNQSTLKPASVFVAYDKLSSANPIERTWTYKCVGDRCIRQHYSGDARHTKRISFQTCAMTCAAAIIWPQPTIKSTISIKSSLSFSKDSVILKMSTPFPAVETLFRRSFNVFVDELKSLEFWDSESGRKRSKDQQTCVHGGISSSNVESHSKKQQLKYDIVNLHVEVHVAKMPEIHLTMETDESYNLTVHHERDNVVARISGNTFFGARHGLMTLQQMIWYDDEDDQLRIHGQAHIEDAPKFKYRGLMLDTSRHYFSVNSIKRTLIGMSHVKLNRFHWHITDSQSFPFQSKYFPELSARGAYSAEEIYTPDNVREITDFASVRGIQIIPEIDAPAHAGNGWDWGPQLGMGDLSLCINQQPWSFYCGEPPCGQLNPKNNNTYMILQMLYRELIDLTGPKDYFHLGGDEVNLECWAQHFNDTDLRGLWCDFMLKAYERLKTANNGVPPRMAVVWSSGLTSSQCLSKNTFAVQVWGGSTWQENYDLIDNGFSVIISHVDAWYFDCGFGSWRSTGDGACSPYRTWQNVYKHRPWERMRLTTTQLKQVLGGEACLWTEQVDEPLLDSRLWPRSAALAERLWTDPSEEMETDVVPQEVFNRLSILRNRLLQLGIQAEPIFPKYCAQNQDECV